MSDGDAGSAPALTPKQAFYVLRYALGRLAIERLRFLFLAKWLLAAFGVALIFVGDAWPDSRIVGVVLLVLFGLAWLAQFAVVSVIRRLAVPRRYRPAFAALESAVSDWWPRLAAELRRVGLPAGLFGVAGLAGRLLLRRLRPEERLALREVRLANVFPGADLRRARQLFEEADARR
jgi:hypothetical protein